MRSPASDDDVNLVGSEDLATCSNVSFVIIRVGAIISYVFEQIREISRTDD